MSYNLKWIKAIARMIGSSNFLLLAIKLVNFVLHKKENGITLVLLGLIIIIIKFISLNSKNCYHSNGEINLELLLFMITIQNLIDFLFKILSLKTVGLFMIKRITRNNRN